MKSIKPRMITGRILGHCPKCGYDYSGWLNTDDKLIKLKCLSPFCDHEGLYKYHWPDELPKVILRHAKSGQLLKCCKNSPKRKRKKKGGDPYRLPGQLSFDQIVPNDQTFSC